LSYGVGFGFDTSRIFRTTAQVPEASAFVRVAAGIESLDETTTIAETLATAYSPG